MQKPTIHNMHRRAFWHDYSQPSFYMLTLVTAGRRPLFGRLMGIPQPHIELSAFGKRLLNEEMQKISRYYPNVHVHHLCIMPDHLHIILRVTEQFPEGKSIGAVVAGFKTGCKRLLGEQVFEEGYNDKILYHTNQLAHWQKYLDDNPRRLFLKQEHPDLFTILHDKELFGRNCQMVGNIFLLDIPDKVAVVVHRAYSDEEYQRYRQQWLACGERGGVIIGTAIAPREKEVMREAMNRGYRIILLKENGFPPLYKPSGEAFDACANGKLLQISPWEYHTERRTISREQCLFLNRLAEDMAAAAKREAPSAAKPPNTQP